MAHERQFYIDGAWVDPVERGPLHPVIDPSTEEPIAEVAMGGAADIDRAVTAAKAAFPAYSRTPVDERTELIGRILAAYEARTNQVAATLTREIGLTTLVAGGQDAMCRAHLETNRKVLEAYAFEVLEGETIKVVREPVGVCGLITPWNAPVSQIICKVVPALAAGCTTVLKPSEVAPLGALLFAEIMDQAGAPKGVFNLVNGDGANAGHALASHPEVDMISFTGSLRGGAAVGKAAADTVKRVVQELGGKSPNIILRDADLEPAVRGGAMGCFFNTGQTCAAPSRMFVPRGLYKDAVEIAAETARGLKVGRPGDGPADLGPLVNRAQFDRVQRYIDIGIAEGARLAAGGPGRPEHLNRGYFVRPTVFADVTPQMTIAQEEIFGPVLSILPYDEEDEAVRLANDTPYGLSAYVQSRDSAHARSVAARLRAGYVQINYPPWNAIAPFGGYKRSGNGRQYGVHGLEEYLEIKSVVDREPW